MKLEPGEWIGVDLDGTLAVYGEFEASDPHRIGAPVPPMVERVRRWLADGVDVRIFTARVGHEGDMAHYNEPARQRVQAWCREHLGAELPVTATKNYRMRQLRDDRALQVGYNTGETVAADVFRAAVLAAMQAVRGLIEPGGKDTPGNAMNRECHRAVAALLGEPAKVNQEFNCPPPCDKCGRCHLGECSASDKKEIGQIAEKWVVRYVNDDDLHPKEAILSALTEALAPVERERDKLNQEIKKLEKQLDAEVGERDDCEQQFSQAYYLATGNSPEWSNNFGHEQAALEIADVVNLLKSNVQQLEHERDELKRNCGIAERYIKKLEDSAASVREGALREARPYMVHLENCIFPYNSCNCGLESLLTTPANEREGCEWKQDEDSMWQSGCGESREDLNPHWKFCPYCGKPIKEAR